MTTATTAPRFNVNAHGNADLQAKMDAARDVFKAIILGAAHVHDPVAAWLAGEDHNYTEADYGAIIDAAKTDARIDADEVLALAVDVYGRAFYTVRPDLCRTCGGDKVVEVERVYGGWGSWDGPQLDYVESACPTCCGDAGDDN